MPCKRYYCRKCKKVHLRHSKIGEEHWENRIKSKGNPSGYEYQSKVSPWRKWRIIRDRDKFYDVYVEDDKEISRKEITAQKYGEIYREDFREKRKMGLGTIKEI